MTARDIVYGRRGGRWADTDTAALADQLDAERKAAGATWGRNDRPCTVCGRTADDHTRCRACGLPEEHHDDIEACWADRARMAAAKADAGRPLNPVDAEALDRCPNPPSSFTDDLFPRGSM